MHQNSREILSGTVRWISAAIVSAALILLLFAAILWKTGISDQYMGLFALCSCTIGSGIAGFGGGQVMKKRGIVYGIIYGMMTLLIIICGLYFIIEVQLLFAFLQPKWLICLAVSGLSGTFSVNLRKE